MNVLISGISGSGKTTIAAALTKRGYRALNMDKVEGLCAWVKLSTGRVADPDFKRRSSEDWVDKYDWLWDKQKLSELLNDPANTYFCGSSGNQKDFYHLFDKVFLLQVDDQLIRDRILNNERDHDYGRRPGEIDSILGYYQRFQNEAKAAGAIVLDAHKSVSELIDLILAKVAA